MNKAQVEFVTRIVTECGPGVGTEQAGDAALRLMQLARKAQRYNLLHCNVGLTPTQEKASQLLRPEGRSLSLASRQPSPGGDDDQDPQL